MTGLIVGLAWLLGVACASPFDPAATQPFPALAPEAPAQAAIPKTPSALSSLLELGAAAKAGSKSKSKAAWDPLVPLNAPPIGYSPETSPYDNPGTGTNLTPLIPSSPDCTVMEIQRMRMSAARIAQSIQLEVEIMKKRKAYVEQMTAYLNDRIRELNKVKSELSQEARWVQMSNSRIEELAAKEKLVKMQDILSCFESGKQKLAGETSTRNKAMTDLKSRSDILQKKIDGIRNSISTVQSGQEQLATDPAAAPKAGGGVEG